jgi:hypothetical protein
MQKADSIDLLGEILYSELNPTKSRNESNFGQGTQNQTILTQSLDENTAQNLLTQQQNPVQVPPDCFDLQSSVQCTKEDLMGIGHKRDFSGSQVPEISVFGHKKHLSGFNNDQQPLFVSHKGDTATANNTNLPLELFHSVNPNLQVNWNRRMANQNQYSPYAQPAPAAHIKHGSTNSLYDEYMMMKLEQDKQNMQKQFYGRLQSSQQYPNRNNFPIGNEVFENSNSHSSQLSESFSVQNGVYPVHANDYSNSSGQLDLQSYQDSGQYNSNLPVYSNQYASTPRSDYQQNTPLALTEQKSLARAPRSK